MQRDTVEIKQAWGGWDTLGQALITWELDSDCCDEMIRLREGF